jgi:hypothetical protein
MRIVFNRPDCPYGCGAALAPDLRWQETPCHRCGRPLFPLTATEADGQVLWPPPSIPRPAEAGQPDVQIWYVVGEEDAREAIAISRVQTQRRLDASDEKACRLVTILLIAVGVVVAAALYVLLLAPR